MPMSPVLAVLLGIAFEQAFCPATKVQGCRAYVDAADDLHANAFAYPSSSAQLLLKYRDLHAGQHNVIATKL